MNELLKNHKHRHTPELETCAPAGKDSINVDIGEDEYNPVCLAMRKNVVGTEIKHSPKNPVSRALQLEDSKRQVSKIYLIPHSMSYEEEFSNVGGENVTQSS